MSGFLDRYGEQFIKAWDSSAGVRRPRVRRSARRAGTAIVIAGVALTGPAIAANHLWGPLLGRPDIDNGSPAASAARPPEATLSVLGVLRREQSPEDRRIAGDGLLATLSPRTTGVMTAYIRAVATSGKRHVAVVPVAEVSQGDIASGSRRIALTDALCLTDGEALSCGNVQDLVAGRLFVIAGATEYGLVPDGVATIVLRYPSGRRLTRTIHDNAYVAVAPQIQRSVNATVGKGQARSTIAVGERPVVQWLNVNQQVIGPPESR